MLKFPLELRVASWQFRSWRKFWDKLWKGGYKEVRRIDKFISNVKVETRIDRKESWDEKERKLNGMEQSLSIIYWQTRELNFVM